MSAADYTVVTALIRQWDVDKYEEALEELRIDYQDVKYYDNRILKKFTVQDFHDMYESRGKVPFNESLFLELLPANKKYARDKEAFIGLPRDYRDWMHKAEEKFQSKPAERQSEQAVKRLLSRCVAAR